LKRNLLRLVDFFPFYLTGFLAAKLTPNHQRLGDLWAQTIVVNRKDDIKCAGRRKSVVSRSLFCSLAIFNYWSDVPEWPKSR
jgi:hypothetical protein